MPSLTPTEFTVLKFARSVVECTEIAWCKHWLYGQMENDARARSTTIMNQKAYDKALRGLVEKKFFLLMWEDNYKLVSFN